MAAKGHKLMPEQRKRIAEGVKRRYQETEFVERQREGVHRHWADPQTRNRAADTMRANWQDPHYREKTLAAFASRPKTFDVAAYRKRYYLENAAAIKARAKAWAKTNPDRVKASRDRRLADEGARLAYNARINEWYRAHPEERQRHKSRRRALERNAFVEDVDRREVLLRHDGICGWCAEPVDPDNFHVDHIVALCLGGEHSYANTQPTHPECNIAKRVVLKERTA